MRETEGKRDGQVLARLVTYIAMGVALEGLWRRQGNMVLRCWDNHGCFLDRRVGVLSVWPRTGQEEAIGEVENVWTAMQRGKWRNDARRDGDGMNVGKGGESVD